MSRDFNLEGHNITKVDFSFMRYIKIKSLLIYDDGILDHARYGQVGLLTNWSRACNYLSFCGAKIGEKLHIFSNGVVVSRNGHGITQAAP